MFDEVDCRLPWLDLLRVFGGRAPVCDETEVESSDAAAEFLLAGFGLGFDSGIGEGSAGVFVVVGGSTTTFGVGAAGSCGAEVESLRGGPPPRPPRPLPRPPLFPRLPSRVGSLR